MNTLEPLQRELAVPLLGQLVNLENPTEVAQALEAVRDAKRILDQARADLEQALVDEAQRQGTKTLHLGALEVKITASETVEWDAHTLAHELRAAGLPEARVSDVVSEVVTYKVNALEARRVAGANPDYAAIVQAHRRVVPATPHAYVKR